MKNLTLVFFSIILFMGMLPAQPAAAQSEGSGKSSAAPAAKPDASRPESSFKDDSEKISYALGMRMALELKVLRKTMRDTITIDPNLVAEGLRDSLSGAKTRLTDDERLTLLSQLQKELEMKEQAVKQQMAEDNLKDGQTFLAANKTKEGVVALPSGLQYKILTPGSGPKPTLNDTVVCNYRGTFIDGKEFDSSYKRGQPSSFPVAGVIRGWTEALQLMPVGSKWQLFVPSNLAYGERGHGRDIEPNAMLIFEVELLSIQEKDKKP